MGRRREAAASEAEIAITVTSGESATNEIGVKSYYQRNLLCGRFSGPWEGKLCTVQFGVRNW